MTTNNNTDFEQQPIEGEQNPTTWRVEAISPTMKAATNPTRAVATTSPMVATATTNPMGAKLISPKAI